MTIRAVVADGVTYETVELLNINHFNYKVYNARVFTDIKKEFNRKIQISIIINSCFKKFIM